MASRTFWRIMCVGDSITYESGGPDGSVWRALLFSLLNADQILFNFVGRQSTGSFPQPFNEGYGGYRIDQLDALIAAAIAANPADLFLVMAGTNDCIQLADGAASRMGALITHINQDAPGALILVSTIPPQDGTNPNTSPEAAALVDVYNAEIVGVVNGLATDGIDVHLVDVGGALTLDDISADGIHPSIPDGYTHFGNLWYAAVRPYLAETDAPLGLALQIEGTGQRIVLNAVAAA